MIWCISSRRSALETDAENRHAFTSPGLESLHQNPSLAFDCDRASNRRISLINAGLRAGWYRDTSDQGLRLQSPSPQ